MYYDHCRISEERFWHNYFYRVFLIKQSSQLSTLASGREHPLSCNTLDTALCVVLSILAAEQKEILPEHKEAAAGKASSGEGSEQQKQTESISESFHAESDLQVRSCFCKPSDVSAKWLITILCASVNSELPYFVAETFHFLSGVNNGLFTLTRVHRRRSLRAMLWMLVVRSVERV